VSWTPSRRRGHPETQAEIVLRLLILFSGAVGEVDADAFHRASE
jgi:hypothetical protein